MAANSVLLDQRIRTSEALERRFALAEAELRGQQQKKLKRPCEENNGTTLNSHSSLGALRSSLTPSPNSSLKKDVEVNDPTYFQLSHPIHDNLLVTSSKFSSGQGAVTNRILHELLQGGDSVQKYLQGSKSKKLENWILLDNLDKSRGASLSARLRALQAHSKRSKKHMSMKQLKTCGSFQLSQELHKVSCSSKLRIDTYCSFDYFKPMHEMWKDYIAKLIKNVGKNQLARCLLNADFHGAMVLVVHCQVVSYTGLSGIMVHETAETFGIITECNKFRVVPKKPSVFVIQVDCWKITLQGDKLASRIIVS